MPLYSYRCKACGWQREDMRKVDERHDGPQCDRCRQLMRLEIDPVAGVVKNPAVPKGSR